MCVAVSDAYNRLYNKFMEGMSMVNLCVDKILCTTMSTNPASADVKTPADSTKLDSLSTSQV